MNNCVVLIQRQLAVSTTNAVHSNTRSVAHHRPLYLPTAVLRITQCVKMANATEHVMGT